MASGAADTVLDCTFEGSGNLYGLGIRLSIYIQYFITSLAYNYNQACFNSISTGNSILRVALLIGVTYAIATGEVTVNIDGECCIGYIVL